ncbi:hypothetical protein vBSlqSZDD2_54 [Serratia phage vB_SlqS_ZDD2]|nr:hypothetical protein vBSlqSZDD2_54 [Serratia phage vB_SlqS_ZDD2]
MGLYKSPYAVNVHDMMTAKFQRESRTLLGALCTYDTAFERNRRAKLIRALIQGYLDSMQAVVRLDDELTADQKRERNEVIAYVNNALQELLEAE